eukprot:Amastigsp_a183314_5.p4 type:complete len:103 gc:universal Amastigsp_a183314_5:148-456(+)
MCCRCDAGTTPKATPTSSESPRSVQFLERALRAPSASANRRWSQLPLVGTCLSTTSPKIRNSDSTNDVEPAGKPNTVTQHSSRRPSTSSSKREPPTPPPTPP